jgi:nicotinamidase-related amidase
MPMDARTTALLLIGYQGDYFSPGGALHEVIEEPSRLTGTLQNTVDLIERLRSTPTLMVTTPIVFSPDYHELHNEVGILRAIKDTKAFRAGSPGAAIVPELAQFGDRLIEVPGKQSLNAFANTQLADLLRARSIRNVVVCGVVASLCIDSTSRAAYERGYDVTIVSNCISGRTLVEQRFYVSEIYPLYSTVLTSEQLLKELGADKNRSE